MPKVSSAPEDAYHFKGSFEEGWGVVVNAKALVFQYPPAKEASADSRRAAGHQDPPGLVACLEIQRYSDGEGTKNPQPTEEVLLSISRAGKDSGMLDTCHPGNYPDGDLDKDPVDCSGALGAEGNTLFAVQDGFQLNDKCKWMRFCTSLQERGFKPQILKRTFFPDLVGLYAYFKNVQAKTGDFDSNLFVVDKIVKFPYEKGAGAQETATTKTAAGKHALATAKKLNGPVATPKTETTTETSTVDAEEIATAVISETLASSQKGALLSNLKKVKIQALMSMNKHKPPIPAELKKAVQDQIADEDWLTAIGDATGTFEVQTDGQVQFA